MTSVHSEFVSGSDLGSSKDTLGQVTASLGLMMLPGNSQLNGLKIVLYFLMGEFPKSRSFY
jgi:hypothetical protein